MTNKTATGDNGDRDLTAASAAQVDAADRHVRVVAVLVAIGGVILLSIATFAVFRPSADADAASTGGGPGSSHDWAGVPLDEPAPRPDFTMTDTRGEPFDFRAETDGRLTLLFFGYTNCPDICPIQLSVLAGALANRGLPQPVVVFVGVDTERDTPEAIRAFLNRFDSRFVGLHGTPEEIADAERQAPAVARSTRLPAPSGNTDGGYLVGHASQVIAYTPDDQAHVVYPSGTRREDWIADLPRLVEQFGTAEDRS